MPLKIRLAYAVASGHPPEVWTVEVTRRDGTTVAREPFNEGAAALETVKTLHLLYAARGRKVAA